MPSLAQLDEAVRAFMAGVSRRAGHRRRRRHLRPPHRLVRSGRPSTKRSPTPRSSRRPPARSDAATRSCLRIAEKVDADVLSNDCFQEFHGEHEWLFDRGRLIGGKPVPGIGWIFTARSPVRGPKSREAVRKARSQPGGDAGDQDRDRRSHLGARRSRRTAAAAVARVRARSSSRSRRAARSAEHRRLARRAPTSEAATQDDGRAPSRGAVPSRPGERADGVPRLRRVAPSGRGRRRHRRGVHESRRVRAASARPSCYMPLSAMGDPPPRAARDVVTKGETRAFVVQALDPPRRGIEIAIPEFANVSGVPSEETVEQEIIARRKPGRGGEERPRQRRPRPRKRRDRARRPPRRRRRAARRRRLRPKKAAAAKKAAA